MKTLITLTGGVLLLVASGCTSTVTLGPEANKDGVVGASASPTSASVTVPFIKAETATTATAPATTDKKE